MTLDPNVVALGKYMDYAEKLQANFVVNFKVTYGPSQIVYNVHFLIHLVQDCTKFRALDNVAVFPLANYLGTLKKFIHRTQNPIAEIVYRKLKRTSIQKKSILVDVSHRFTKKYI